MKTHEFKKWNKPDTIFPILIFADGAVFKEYAGH